jgi:BirA family transcriptional regulator, biotin operon repressor / biotin---[acetyl-CoA-carboxylase] ligase
VSYRELHETLPSTQDRAIELARLGAPPGTRIVAREQTEGRGRLDRVWFSPPGGVYLSLVLADPPATPQLLSLAVAAAVRRALHSRWSVPGFVKWPNDLVVRGVVAAEPRKLAGLIADRVEGPNGIVLVLGVGMNVAAHREAFPPDLLPHLAFVEEYARPPPDPESVEEEIAGASASAATRVSTPEGRAAVVAELRSVLYGVGTKARIDGRLVGRILGVSYDGALELDGRDGLERVHAGELTLVTS